MTAEEKLMLAINSYVAEKVDETVKDLYDRAPSLIADRIIRAWCNRKDSTRYHKDLNHMTVDELDTFIRLLEKAYPGSTLPAQEADEVDTARDARDMREYHSCVDEDTGLPLD